MPIPTRVTRGPRAMAKPSGATLVMVATLAIGISLWAVISLHSHERLTYLTAQQIKAQPFHTKHPIHHQSLHQKCHVDKHNEYHGDVVLWGANNNQSTESECCESCIKAAGCNIWVWCGGAEGCGAADNRRPFGECWLKNNSLDYVMANYKKGAVGIHWVSGAVYTEEEEAAWKLRAQQAEEANIRRLEELKDNPELPLVYVDVTLLDKPLGRIEMVLFAKESPRAAENLRVLCSGEKGGKYTMKGALFYRIIDRFIDQTGAGVDGIFDAHFHDDPGGLALKHDRPGLLSMANSGPNTNGGHFSLVMGPAHHLDGSYTIFGEIVSGFEFAETINSMSKGRPNNELLNSPDAKIVDAGQLRKGTYTDSKLYQEVLESERRRIAWRNKAPQADIQRYTALRQDEDLPLVWFDVAIKGRYAGRIEFVLFAKDSPLASENFRLLCTGEAGVAKRGHQGAGTPYHFRNMTFYRIVKDFIDQGGRGTDSPLGGQYLDDPGGLKLKHDRMGLLSIAHLGHNTSTSHFSIMMGPQGHLDAKHVIFGEAVDGHHVIFEVNALSEEAPNKRDLLNAPHAVVIDSGMTRLGHYSQTEAFKKIIFAERERLRLENEKKGIEV